MMNTNVRILVVAAAVCGLLGAALPLAAADTPAALGRMTATSGSDGVTLRMPTDSAMDVVHYSPQPGVWVVEMPEAQWSGEHADAAWPELGIDSARLEHVDEFGKRVSRLTLRLSEPATLTATSTSSALELRLIPVASLPVSTDIATQPSHADTSAMAAPETPRPAATVGTAASLLAVEPVQVGDGVVVSLYGDRAIDGRAFVLPDPARVVIDLPGVINRVDRHVFAVNAPLVRRVRVAQYRAVPEPITRVVIDLEADAGYAIEATNDGAVIRVGPDPHAMPVSHSRAAVVARTDTGGTTTVTNAAPVATEEIVTAPAQVVASVADGSADSEPAALVIPNVPIVDEPVEPRVQQTPERVERNPWVADPSQLVEKAPAAQTVDAGPASGQFEVTEVESGEQQFTGEPITLTLKDADIKDVLRTFAKLTGLNIVLDPGASGSVTVELYDVPWDQALDLVLRINDLDYVLENNVMRVAPIAKLEKEKADRARFDQQQQLAQPLKTVIKPLSYAKASEMKELVTGVSQGGGAPGVGGAAAGGFLLSARGTLVVDERTNQLIIRDTIDRVEGILRLIEQLDAPTPQVVIEGRFVETTRVFSREIGITWGYSGFMDAEHGNTTGLTFPNEITSEGSVNLLQGGQNGIISFAFADILNTFNLDFTLSAAESSGDARVVSSPRITTQNLKKATIRSGLQIPIQTVANNTVTVQYVDATLKLDVTPQITAEGTINLQVDIRKQQPLQAGQVVGGQNAPILTRDAQTELLVRDGGTTVIGGIYQIDQQESEDRVPGLHKIPILGWMFKNTGSVLNHDELLIFITPRIVKY
jgi:type IV pilus assembly protein PilQ